jgi:hypothetical protein
MPHEHEQYEDEYMTGAEETPEYDAPREYEPANDNTPKTEADTIDARLGGEKDDWPTEDRGESGYLFDGRDVIGPDGVSWLAAWGESAENIALYDEMVTAFSLGEIVFQLPDHTEYRDDGETLYKTFMLLSEDGSVGYEIRPHDIQYANDNEPLLFDDEDEADDEQDRIATNDNALEPPTLETLETVADDARAAEATFMFAMDDAVRATEYAPLTEQTAAETIAQEHLAYAEEPHVQEEDIAPVLHETPAHVAQLLESVTYHVETTHDTAEPIEAPVARATEEAIEPARAETAPEMMQTVVEHRHEMCDILDIIPNLPTYANRDMEPPAAAIPEMRADTASIPPAIVTEAVILAAEAAMIPAVTPERATMAAQADSVPSPSAAVQPTATRETAVRPFEPKREAPRTPERTHTAPRATEKARGGFAERPRREAARPAPPETAHPLARIMRGREPVHPARQTVNAHRFAHAHSMNDNTASHTSPSATLHGITLRRAA